MVYKQIPIKSQRYGDDFYYILYHNEYRDYGLPWPIEDSEAVTGPAEREYPGAREWYLFT